MSRNAPKTIERRVCGSPSTRLSSSTKGIDQVKSRPAHGPALRISSPLCLLFVIGWGTSRRSANALVLEQDGLELGERLRIHMRAIALARDDPPGRGIDRDQARLDDLGRLERQV